MYFALTLTLLHGTIGIWLISFLHYGSEAGWVDTFSMMISHPHPRPHPHPQPLSHTSPKFALLLEVLLLIMGDFNTTVGYYVLRSESWKELQPGLYALNDRLERLETIG